MSSEHLASAQTELKGELGASWNILDGASANYTDLGIARRFGGAAAAYSLRDIGAMNGRVVTVRREPHDTDATINDEQDFSANQVQSGALEDWVNGNLESTLPADVATAAAAYSLRKVKASYAEDAVRIRRSSDDIEVNVAFDSDDKISASSVITNVAEQGGESGQTTATDLNGFLNESVSGFTSVPYSGINASYKNFTSDPTISDTAFSGTNGGTQSRLVYLNTTDAFVTASDFDGCKVKVTGTVNTLSGGDLTVKPATSNTGGGSWTPPEGNKVISNGTTGSFEYIFTGNGIDGFRSVIFLVDASTTVNVSNLTFKYIEHGATVHTWYDQAGSNDAVQATAANQPKIASSGTLLSSLDYSDGGKFLKLSSTVSVGEDVSVFGVATKSTGTDILFDARTAAGAGFRVFEQANVQKFQYDGTTVASSFNRSAGNNFLITAIQDGTNAKIAVNANALDTASETTVESITPTPVIGGKSFSTVGADNWEGTISEIIYYTSDQTDNRFKIESNINNYYGLYNDANETNGNFVASGTNSSFTANGKLGFTATSIANGTDGGGAIELNETVASGDRLYISFNSTKASSTNDGVALRQATGGTIASQQEAFKVGFNSFSLLANASNADFVVFRDDSGSGFTISDLKVSRIARNGFVETWYDQSGDGLDMTQTAAADQPHIVENGGICKDPSGTNPTGKFVNVGTNLGSTFLSNSSHPTANQVMSAYFVASTETTTPNRQTLSGGTSDIALDADEQILFRRGGNNRAFSNLDVSINTNNLIVVSNDSSYVPTGRLNGTSQSNVAFSGGAGEKTFEFLGENSANASNDTFGLQGTISEAILYNDIEYDADIESDIANYYNITLS